MWGDAVDTGADYGLHTARLWRLQRLQGKSLSWSLVYEALIDWLTSLGSASQIAHAACLVCFVIQVLALDAFMVRYLDFRALVTLCADIPLFVHALWYWRDHSAHRMAATQWLCYSWLHAAKVVVLFVRVMPRLPVSMVSLQDIIFAEDNSSMTTSVQVATLYNPTTLGNLLLITPVFYALMMFRVGRAIFGESKRITVDLLLHYDMLWHVVIDMVDQVDMFYYARVAERLDKDDIAVHQPRLVDFQTVIAFLLFLSIGFQAQALPGVATDAWTLPKPQGHVTEKPRLSSSLATEPPPPPPEPTTSEMPRKSAGAQGGRGESPEPSPSGLRPRSVGNTPEPTSTPPRWPQQLDGPAPKLLGKPHSFGSRTPTTPVSPGQLEMGNWLKAQIGPRSPWSPPRSRPRSGSDGLLHEGVAASSSGLMPLMPRSPAAAAPAATFEPQAACPGASRIAMPPGTSPLRSSARPLGPLLAAAAASAANATTTSIPDYSHRPRPVRSNSKGLQRFVEKSGRGRRPEDLSRKSMAQWERVRRSSLQAILHHIQRQGVVIARKRSAMVSIFFVDLPFLALRMWLWFMLGHSESLPFPGFGVKNAICIILNVMQFPAVSLAYRNAFMGIQRQLAAYRVRFCSADALAEVEAQVLSNVPVTKGVSAELWPSNLWSTPLQISANPAIATAARRMSCKLPSAEKEVRRETVRSASICLYFWSLFMGFLIGLLFAKGESALTRSARWFVEFI